MNTIYLGDVVESLKLIPENHVNCCITSPPYWSLRDYGKDDQLGNEETPQEYIDKLVRVFREVKRVLKEDGTLWLNLGDVYNGQSNKFGYKPKELMGLPWKVAFALQEDGWYLRSDIIWNKPNPMPESVKDRPTKAHEYIFLFSKKPKYHYDYLAIMEEAVTQTKTTKTKNSKYGSIENEKKHRQGLHGNRGENLVAYRPDLPPQKKFVDFLRSKTNSKKLAENTNIKKTTIDHWFRYDDMGFAYPTIEDWNNVKWLIDDFSKEFNKMDLALTYVQYRTDEVRQIKEGYKNKRTVWNVPTKPFKGAHFAVFPEKLIEPCVLAGSREGDIVMDCFMGSGTTGVQAIKHGRTFYGIELNEEYLYNVALPRLESKFKIHKV